MAYSFGRQKRFSLRDAQNISNSSSIDFDKWKAKSNVKNPYGIVIGRAKRAERIETDGPGPAAYAKPSLFAKEAPRAIMIGKPRESRILTAQPGPGSYELDKLDNFLPKNPKFSFGHSEAKEREENSPGPAAYNQQLATISKTGPVVVFGKSKREFFDSHKNVPGPGQYNTGAVATESSIQYQFPHEQKFKHQNDYLRTKTEIPGPGSYNVENKRIIRGGVLNRSIEKIGNDMSPGPGAYDIDIKRHRSPEATIGNSPRSLTGRIEKGPGPTSYNIPPVEMYKKMNTSSISFSKDRREHKIFTQTPGPGAYQTFYDSTSSVKKGITIPGRNSVDKVEMGPGPQSYEPRAIFPKEPRTIFTRSKKNRLLIDNIPGPGKYNTDEDRRVKSFYFPKQKRRQNNQTTPGPGQYKLKPLLGQLPQYSKPTQDQEVLFV